MLCCEPVSLSQPNCISSGNNLLALSTFSGLYPLRNRTCNWTQGDATCQVTKYSCWIDIVINFLVEFTFKRWIRYIFSKHYLRCSISVFDRYRAFLGISDCLKSSQTPITLPQKQHTKFVLVLLTFTGFITLHLCGISIY